MHVLTRKLQQEIIIDGSVRVTVLEIRHGRVKIGVSAPEHVDISRKESTGGPPERPLQRALAARS